MSAAAQARNRLHTRRPRDRRLRARPLHVVLGLRHPVLDRRVGRGARRARGPDAGGAPRGRHRRPAAARGGRHRPGPARGARPGSRRRRRGPRGFDQLVYAAGAVPVVPDWARVRGDGVFGVQTLDDGAAIHAWLDRHPRPRRAVVVGSGYVGVEMAEAMVLRGLDVTLLEKAGHPMARTVDAGHRGAGAGGDPRPRHHRAHRRRGRGHRHRGRPGAGGGHRRRDAAGRHRGAGPGRTPEHRTRDRGRAVRGRDRRTAHRPADAGGGRGRGVGGRRLCARPGTG